MHDKTRSDKTENTTTKKTKAPAAASRRKNTKYAGTTQFSGIKTQFQDEKVGFITSSIVKTLKLASVFKFLNF